MRDKVNTNLKFGNLKIPIPGKQVTRAGLFTIIAITTIKNPAMRSYFRFFSLCFLLLGTYARVSAQALPARDEAAIRAIMAAQEAAWNRGDLEAFMKGYWEDEGLKFIGKTGVTYGWQATLDRYRKGYPDRAAMGTLHFDLLHIERISSKAALVVGKWTLARAEDQPGGHFSLTWRKMKGTWVIVADHSS